MYVSTLFKVEDYISLKASFEAEKAKKAATQKGIPFEGVPLGSLQHSRPSTSRGGFGSWSLGGGRGGSGSGGHGGSSSQNTSGTTRGGSGRVGGSGSGGKGGRLTDEDFARYKVLKAARDQLNEKVKIINVCIFYS